MVLSGSKFVGSALGFVATVYFANVLGETVLGKYALVLALVTWVGIVGEVGLSKALIKRLSEGEEPRAFVGAGVVILGSLFLVVGTGVLVFRSWVNDYVGMSMAVEFVLILLLLNLFTTLTTAALQGHHLVHVYGGLTVLERILRSGLQLMLVFLGFGLIGMLAGYAAAGFVAGLAAAGYLGLRPAMPRRHHIKSLLDFAKYAWLGNVSNRAYTSLDVAILGLFVSTDLVGVYSVAWSIATFLSIFGGSLEGTLFPEMSKLSAGHGREAVRDLTEDALLFSGLIAIPGLVGALVIGDLLMAIYGEGFVRGVRVLGLLIGAALVFSYVRQLRNTLNAVDRPDLAFRVNAGFTLANVVLNVALIIAYGWVGAAVATLASSTIGALLAYWYARDQVGAAMPTGEIARQGVAALAMGGTVYLARGFVSVSDSPASNFLVVLGLVGASTVLYFVLMYGLSPRFRLAIRENIPIFAWLPV